MTLTMRTVSGLFALLFFIAGGRLIGFVVDGNPVQPTLMAFCFEIVIAAVLLATSRKLTAAA